VIKHFQAAQANGDTVAASPVSEARVREMFEAVDAVLRAAQSDDLRRVAGEGARAPHLPSPS
jgi:hypothetical protein